MRHSLALLLLLGFPLAAQAQQAASPGPPLVALAPAIDPAALEAGEAALKTLKKLVDEHNLRSLGFASLDEVESARLGSPLSDAYVPLDKLRTYVPGSDAKALLVPGLRVIFPVLVGDAVRSSVTVFRTAQGGFQTASLGAPRLMGALAEARKMAASAHGRAVRDFVLVRVPALGAQFLAFASAGQVLFVVVNEDRRFDFRGGETLPAAEVLGRMVEAARRLDPRAPG